MSLTLNMVGGGGGGLKATDALLRVQAPANSTVTITKGTTTKTDLGHENADDHTVYDYYFIIHQSQFDSVNPWTVTATLNGATASSTIIIDAADEYDLILAYVYYIIKDGVYTDNTLVKYDGNSSEVDETGDKVYKMTDANFTTWYTNTQINLSNYSALKVVLTGGKFRYFARFGFRTTKTALSTQESNIFDLASASIGQSGYNTTEITTPTTLTADISNLSSSAWFGFTLEGTSAITDTTYGKGGIKVTDIYLEA